MSSIVIRKDVNVHPLYIKNYFDEILPASGKKFVASQLSRKKEPAKCSIINLSKFLSWDPLLYYPAII